jgi:DNA-binding PadR family transcriptional regulator
MPIHHAILGLLTEGPSHGYQLKSNFEQSIGPEWGELNIGHLYQILDRLMRDKLVTRRAVAQADRPDKLVYRLTKPGERELDRWLAAPIGRQGGYREEHFLKIATAARQGPDRLRALTRSERAAYTREIELLEGQLRARGDEPIVALLIEGAILVNEAALELLRRAEERAGRLSRARVSRG